MDKPVEAFSFEAKQKDGFLQFLLAFIRNDAF